MHNAVIYDEDGEGRVLNSVWRIEQGVEPVELPYDLAIWAVRRRPDIRVIVGPRPPCQFDLRVAS